MTRARVTVAVPVYTRLRHVPGVLRALSAQDHPDFEIIVSDNGQNGEALEALVERYCRRPCRLRQNPVTVPVVTHFNQLLAAATGDYFVLLCDDDEISEDFVSQLAATLDAHPGAAVAIPRPETMDPDGRNIRRYAGEWPGCLPGDEFIRAWTTRRLRLMSTVTLMVRTEAARDAGGYAGFPRALLSDNLLLVQLALRGDVALAPSAVFRWRMDAASTGFSAPLSEIAAACRQYLSALVTDPGLSRYAAEYPRTWREIHRLLREHCATWYYFRWVNHETRLSRVAWVRAALDIPLVGPYAPRVLKQLAHRARDGMAARFPTLRRAVRTLRPRRHTERAMT